MCIWKCWNGCMSWFLVKWMWQHARCKDKNYVKLTSGSCTVSYETITVPCGLQLCYGTAYWLLLVLCKWCDEHATCIVLCICAGRIGIVDYDRVKLNNLHRQLLHSENSTGQPKVFSAADSLRKWVLFVFQKFAYSWNQYCMCYMLAKHFIQGDQKVSVHLTITIPTQSMIRRGPSQNTFRMWTVLYLTRSSRTQFGVSINVWRLARDTLTITCNFLYCNHQVRRDFLITL
jgi:hypothetical protein